MVSADSAARLGVNLQSLDTQLVSELDALLPKNWSRSNPIDIIGDAPVERYSYVLEKLLKLNPKTAILLIHSPTAVVSSKAIALACLDTISDQKDKVFSCWLGDDSVTEARALFQRARIADYATPEEAVKAFSMLRTYI